MVEQEDKLIDIIETIFAISNMLRVLPYILSIVDVTSHDIVAGAKLLIKILIGLL